MHNEKGMYTYEMHVTVIWLKKEAGFFSIAAW